MKQAIIVKGKVVLEEVPHPICGSGEILVQNIFSLISAGTELSSLDFSRKSLVGKVLNYPDKIQKGMKMVKDRGLANTYNVVKGILDFGQPAGYSSAGRVVEVGKNVAGFKVGDLVACGGAGYANHAEFIRVPKNLAVKIPEGADLRDASSTTVGSIAMQGVRQADVELGEYVLVMGLGLIGQLTVQILKASGATVIGTDVDEKRVKLALANGADYAYCDPAELKKHVERITYGHGADKTIITASTPSSDPINAALEMTRKKGVVVAVGSVGLEIKRPAWYEKEIDLRISTSYGPGRYDHSYEEGGVDYPYHYVRWTENRNMSSYVELISSGKVSLEKLVPKVFPFEEIGNAYSALTSEEKPLAVFIEYPKNAGKVEKKVFNPAYRGVGGKTGLVRLGIIGAGSFVTAVHLPNLFKLAGKKYELVGISTHDGAKANNMAKQYGFKYATADYKEILSDKNIDAVIIATRHNSHARLLLESMRAGKHVFIEKPLALTAEEVGEIKKYLASQEYKDNPRMFFVGFNRRFSPLAIRLHEKLSDRKHPLVANFRVNDSYAPADNWVNTEEGGGRLLGNGCHMIDFFRFLVNAPAVEYSALSISDDSSYYLPTDNFSASIRYTDGSIANLFYSVMGDQSLPKERLEVFSEGCAYVLEDFRSLDVKGGGGSMRLGRQDKGQLGELVAFADALRDGKWLIPAEELLEVTESSLLINELILK